MDDSLGERVIIGNNGELAVVIPLYVRRLSENLGKMEGYSIQLVDDKPTGYLLDVGAENFIFVNSELIDKQLNKNAIVDLGGL